MSYYQETYSSSNTDGINTVSQSFSVNDVVTYDTGSVGLGNTLEFSANSAGAVLGSNNTANQVAADLLLLNNAATASRSYEVSNSGFQSGASTTLIGSTSSNATFLSQVEQAILRSNVPIEINESEEITVNGQRGIWANRQEVINWRGVIPITEYLINEDSNPEIITKRSQQTLEYIQELAIRYLKPPTPPAPGEIIITQEVNTLTPPAPPLIIRQQPARPGTPEPLVIREAPPQPPAQVGRKVITISGKRIPPAPRKVIIERLAPLPSKPQSVIVERWLPYSQVKRRVIFQRSNERDAVVVKPRNVIVQWEAPQVVVKKEFKYLGVIRANPVEYVQRYGSTLKASRDLPGFVLEIKNPEGIVLAADYKYNSLYELEGEVQALRLVDLDREGLSEYRSYLQRLGISFVGASNIATSSSQIVTSASSGSFGASYGTSTGGSYQSVSVSSGGLGVSNNLIASIFSQLDKDGNGQLSVEEAEKIFLKLNSRLNRSYGENEVRAFFQALDKDRNGVIDLNEFRVAFERLQ